MNDVRSEYALENIKVAFDVETKLDEHDANGTYGWSSRKVITHYVSDDSHEFKWPYLYIFYLNFRFDQASRYDATPLITFDQPLWLKVTTNITI